MTSSPGSVTQYRASSIAAASLDEPCDRLLQVIATRERKPAVGLVLADGGSRGVHGGSRRWDVGVEVLQAKDVGIVARSRCDPIDAEARDLLEAPNAH